MSVIDLKWDEAAEETRIRALVMANGQWTERRYSELKVGDIFKAVDRQGQQVDPITIEPCTQTFAKVMEPPFRNLKVGDKLGWMVKLDTGTMDSLFDPANNAAPGPIK